MDITDFVWWIAGMYPTYYTLSEGGKENPGDAMECLGAIGCLVFWPVTVFFLILNAITKDHQGE